MKYTGCCQKSFKKIIRKGRGGTGLYVECKYKPKKKPCRDYEMIKISALILMKYYPCLVMANEQDLDLSTKACRVQEANPVTLSQ